MSAAIKMRGDYSSAELGRLARKSHDRGQVLRLLALAAVLERVAFNR